MKRNRTKTKHYISLQFGPKSSLISLHLEFVIFGQKKIFNTQRMNKILLDSAQGYTKSENKQSNPSLIGNVNYNNTFMLNFD